jgi:hypothetical protein
MTGEADGLGRFECGFLDLHEGIRGFALDRDNPRRPVEVEIVVAGESVGTARADSSGAELPQRGARAHTFTFHLRQIPTLPCQVHGRVAGSRATFGPLRIETSEELATALEPALRYDGHVEELVRGKGLIRGWVHDRFRPNARLRVALRDWEEPLTSVRADGYRPTLERAGKGDGRCGFVIHLPVEILDNEEHTLRVTVEDTNFAIPGSPIVFQPDMARDLIEIIAPWREDILRIEWIVERLDELARGEHPRAGGVNELLDKMIAGRASKHARARSIRNFADAFVLPQKGR